MRREMVEGHESRFRWERWWSSCVTYQWMNIWIWLETCSEWHQTSQTSELNITNEQLPPYYWYVKGKSLWLLFNFTHLSRLCKGVNPSSFFFACSCFFKFLARAKSRWLPPESKKLFLLGWKQQDEFVNFRETSISAMWTRGHSDEAWCFC